MVVQGTHWDLDPDHIYFYNNTLQAIAAGYLIASIPIPTVPSDADNRHDRPSGGILAA